MKLDPSDEIARDTLRMSSKAEDVEDWSVAVITFEDGTKATVHANDITLGGVRNTVTAYLTNAVVQANINPNNAVTAYAPDGRTADVALPLTGEHHVSNALAALAAADAAGADLAAAAAALATARVSRWRMEVLERPDGLVVVNDAYNANPASMAGALDTLARLSEAPGDLAGFGPVIADIARQVAEAQVDGEWRFTITDPGTGLPIHDGTTRRRPTASQRRRVEARDRTCVFPGCRMPASQCDLDHRIPWSQAHRTSASGLDAACRHDHVTVRHRLGWTHQPLPGGDHLWTSPLGHQYTKSGRPP